MLLLLTTIGIVETIVETATGIPLVQEVKVNKDLTGEVLENSCS